MDLNVPDTRQMEIATRLESGQHLVALELAQEFAVSVDTIRRDILALEASGKARRVRGGAVPCATPSAPLHERIEAEPPANADMFRAAIRWISDAPTLLIDGGRTTLGLIDYLPVREDRLIITPSAWVAVACQNKGLSVFVLGGMLRPRGGIATGDACLDRAAEVSADIAILGACGIDAAFGLSTDDHDEAMVKRALHAAASRTMVITQSAKLGRRARHHTLALNDIDAIVTDAAPEALSKLAPDVARRVVSHHV
ncbi:DeoR/GlpR family DNA-binding transcription regulator [Primorskyibacter sp. S187A]|uniref:DeoR/GlpR family DNA-binding transcription regulator n=1 Tax=Primorskyibacter sp. S187A TaxID=3415130 RepID=UPI003C7E3731